MGINQATVFLSDRLLDSFDVTNKLEYLWNLEIPFLVGVVDQKALRLTIYSGENLPIFFSHKGCPGSLNLELCERTEKLDLDDYIIQTGNDQYTVSFPKLVDIKADVGAKELESKVEVLYEMCSLTYDNIASRRNGEYIFKIYGSEPPQVVTFAGETSAQSFRENFLKRLAEVFHNLQWIYENNTDSFDEHELYIYELLYRNLMDLNVGVPAYVSKRFYDLKRSVEGEPLIQVGSFWAIDPDAENYND
jgi:hypothetical protein